MNRKDFIQNASLLALGSSLKLPTTPAAEPESKKSSLKVVFLSDVHVTPGDVPQEGMRKAWRKANELKPHFIINGGDSIMDALAADKAKTQAQWDVWNAIYTAENHLPVYHVIGNHDIWGWQLADESIKADPLYEKGWVIKQLNMPGKYYSFQKENWKFIVLDSAQQNGGGYIARLDEQQFTWLEQELKATLPDQHVCIVSHIPIVCFCAAMFFDEMLPNGDWKLSRALLHVDSRRITELFSQHKNIKACLSGHIHLQDMVNYKGIQYYCNGAVSGNWWSGAFKGFDPAFAVFNFNKDGSVNREMVSY